MFCEFQTVTGLIAGKLTLIQYLTFDFFVFFRNLTMDEPPQFLMYNCSANCTALNFSFSDILAGEPITKAPITQAGNDFYSYFTPFILIIGLFGNLLSLSVFLSKNMRKMSASIYLASLSTADISTLLFYVFIEWLRRGLIHISPGSKIELLEFDGICQTLLYLSYISRMMSAWIIVLFTIERYMGVCHPFKRHSSSQKGTIRILVALLLICCALVLYKPILSGSRTIGNRTACASKPESIFTSYILDSVYAIIITFIPFLIISVLNSLIIRKLVKRHKGYKENQLITEENTIRLEFTVILLAISFFFIAFNLPFFIVWSRNFLYHRHLISQWEPADIDYWNAVLSITRTIFYMNYCTNFFLYTVTGAYFRRELKAMFEIFRLKRSGKYSRCSRNTNSTRVSHFHNPNTWL